MSCTKCELHQKCKSVNIQPDGKGDIVFLGEAPGGDEDFKGKPFVGASGNFLRNIVESIGLSLDDVRYTNSVRCRPPDNKTPGKRHIVACLPNLLEEFIERPPKIIVPLGNVALKALREAGLLSIRGTITQLNGKAIKEENWVVFPILHPAYILRNPGAMELYSTTFNELERLIKEGYKEPEPIDYDFSDEVEDLEAAIDEACKAGIVAYDVETTSLHPKDSGIELGAKIICFSLSWREYQAFGFHITDDNRDEAFKVLHDKLLENPDVVKIIQHFKFELMWSMAMGRTIVNVEDTMLMHWHVNERNGTHGLAKLSVEYTDLGFYDSQLEDYKAEHKEADPSKKYKDDDGNVWKGTYGNIPIEILLPYNCYDTDATIRIRNILKPMLNEKQLKVHDEIQIPACYPIAEMELKGVNIDWDHCNWMGEKMDEEVDNITSKIFSYPEVELVNDFFMEKRGEGINLNSPGDLRVLLFESMGLPPVYQTKTGLDSTDKHVLDYLSKKHEVPKLLKQLKAVKTLKSTFVDGLVNRRRGDTIHSSYGMAHTETGRYNSRDPNLQNIPRNPLKVVSDGEELSLSVKDMYIPDDGESWLCQIDYSQVELRVMAIMSNDRTMLGYFNEGVDVHLNVAARIHKTDPENISKEQRTMAKRTVFGLIYGQSAQGLSEELGISYREAETFLGKFFKEFPAVKNWMDETQEFVKAEGYVETMFGRKRRLPDAMIKDPNSPLLSRALRQAVNARIQGGAADILAMKKGELWAKMGSLGLKSRMLLTVHDQLLFSIPDSEISEMLLLAKCVMEDFSEIPEISIPIVADVEIGGNWSHLVTIDKDNLYKIIDGESALKIYESLI